MEKTVNPGKIKVGNFHRPIFCKIKIEDGNLSISGVVDPHKGGNCFGSCGQIIVSFKEYDKRGYESLADIETNSDWTPEMLKKFFDIWDKWHLNDMKAECEHQRALGWKYEDHHDPQTFKGELCPTCGYSIGSAWLKEELPADVVSYLASLPDTKIQPAWV